MPDAHVMLVQRQIGTKIGTGGSSGYQYLRATIRYSTKLWKVLCKTSVLLNVPMNGIYTHMYAYIYIYIYIYIYNTYVTVSL